MDRLFDVPVDGLALLRQAQELGHELLMLRFRHQREERRLEARVLALLGEARDVLQHGEA